MGSQSQTNSFANILKTKKVPGGSGTCLIPRTLEAGAGGSPSWRPAWSSEQVIELNKDNLSQKKQNWESLPPTELLQEDYWKEFWKK